VTQNQMTQNHNTMRKTVILLMTLTLVVTSIGAATAKGRPPDKPDKPSSDPVYYDVTMDLLVDGSDGLSTEMCGDDRGDDPFVMRLEESRSGSLLATADGAFPSDDETSEPDLYLRAGFTEPANGCWYGTGTDTLPADSGADFFRMVFDSDGALEKITWHFDVVMEGTTVTHKYALTSKTEKGRNAARVEWDGNLAGDPTEGIVTGSFELWNYTNIDGPVWELIDTSELKFDLSIELWTPPKT